MSTLWRKNIGRAVAKTSGGAILECAICPCACSGDILDAIRERQKSAKLTPLDAGTTTFPLDELRDAVNAMAPKYIDGIYSGGASAPTFLTSSYADGALTCQELFDLVKDMLTTQNDQRWRDWYLYEGFGTSHPTEAAAKAAAISDYQEVDYFTGPSTTPPFRAFKTSFISNPIVLWDSGLESRSLKSEAYNMDTTGPSKTIRFFGFSSEPFTTTFSKQGYTIPDEDEWGVMQTTGSTSAASFISDDWLGTTFPSPLWQVDDTLKFGFELTTMYLIDVNFTHT